MSDSTHGWNSVDGVVLAVIALLLWVFAHDVNRVADALDRMAPKQEEVGE